MIILNNGEVDLLIDILRDHIFVHTGDEYSDKATHPIEVNLLDRLIEKRSAADIEFGDDPTIPYGDNFPATGQMDFDYGE